ncbi:hypothetical protein [Mesorhizobium huakuii]|uniref:Glycosyltransferase family 2 protein n=1 Tax=Mesorhizobium huakuii TaxID=28104 RepID=A0ABZ0VJ47_9HYPH|nr:hypothetical protein [Mesorhizobium huakuii]WQB97492.1 hypothetical protein U0R22_001625 [Mesorhizobium huakuii]
MANYVVNDEGKIAVNLAFQPIIYTTVYGPDLYYECLSIFLESLIRYGGYVGPIVIFSDRSIADVGGYIPESAASQISLVSIGHRNYSQRYVSENFDMTNFSPIVYFDNDIIFDLEFDPILRRVGDSCGVCVVTEDEVYPDLASKKVKDILDERRIGNWWGLDIIKSDPNCWTKVFPLANSGVIGFSDYYAFNTVGRLVFDLFNSKPNQSLAKWFGDQPFLNYALVRTGFGEYETLRHTCHLLGSSESFPKERRGLAHFNWARNEDKPSRMKAYMDYLELHKDS